jgi:hypothetical protein
MVTDYVGYGGAAGCGKTALGCYWLLELGFYLNGARFFIGRDSIKDTKVSVIKTWSEVAKKIGFSGYEFTGDGILFSNGTEVELLDLSFYPQKDPVFERLGSKEYTAGWIEEASQVNYLAFETLKTRVGRWKNEAVKSKILCTFNPKKNWIDAVFYRPFANGKESKDTRFIYALPSDNPFLPSDYIKRLHELKDEATKQRLLFGNFNYDDSPNTMCDYGAITAIFKNDIVKKTGKYYITADIARFGADKAIIIVWDDWVVVDHRVFAISKTTDIQLCIEHFRHKYKIPKRQCLADDDGVGGGVVDNCGILGFVNNGRPFDGENYQNLQSQCGYKLAEKINGGEVGFECDLDENTKEAIISELQQLQTYDSDSDGKLKIKPKELIKQDIGHSPDWRDVFLMRAYFEYQRAAPKPQDLTGYF